MRFVPLMIAVAACGTNSAPPIPVVVPGQPVLMTLKLGTGAWKAVAGTYDANANSTTYQIEVTDEFELVGACVRANSTFFASEVFGTVDDATVTLGAWTVPNCVKQSNGLPPPPSTTNVMFTATADVDAALGVDGIDHPLSAGVPRTITTWQGLHDVIAFDPTDSRILVQHDVEIDGGTDLGTLAVGARGEPMLSRGYGLDLQPDEGVSISTYLLTAHDAVHVWDSTDHSTAMFVPPDQMAAGDLQKFAFEVTAPPLTFRGATSTQIDQVVPDFPLLPRLTEYSTQPGEMGGSWTPFPDFYTDVLITLDDMKSTLDVSKSKLWLDRHATSTVDFDTDVTGYDPSWTIANPYLSLEVRRWNETITLFSGTELAHP